MSARDLAVLTSILWSAQNETWHNVGRSIRLLRPSYSSLAVDIWNVPIQERQRVRSETWLQYGEVLSLFSRVLFLATGSRGNLSTHVKVCPSYFLNWHSAFGWLRADGGHSHSPDEPHMEQLPSLLIGIDADIEMPKNFDVPLETMLSVLEESLPNASNLAQQEAEMVQLWSSLQPMSKHPYVYAPQRRSCTAQACTSTPPKQLAFVGLHLYPRSLLEAGTIFNPFLQKYHRQQAALLNAAGVGDCCPSLWHGNMVRPDWSSLAGSLGTAWLSRSPWCPPTQFFALHKRSLPRMLAMLRVWRVAFEQVERLCEITGAAAAESRCALKAKSTHDASSCRKCDALARLEYVGCSMLGPGQGVLHIAPRGTRAFDGSRDANQRAIRSHPD